MSMFQIIDFAPQEGDAGARLHVRTRVAQTQSRVFLRLVVGNIAVATEIYDEGYDGIWRLEGEMPPLHSTHSPTPFVSLTVQAVNQDNQVLDQETLGTFKYLSAPQMPGQAQHRQSRSRVSSVSSNFSHISGSPTQMGIPLGMAHHAANAANAARRGSIASTMSSSSGHTRGPPPSSIGTGYHRRRILRRREPGEDDPAERVVIDFATSIDDLGRNFTDEERNLGRRLVLFQCELNGNRLIISGKPIRQDDYSEETDSLGATMSCIYRAGAETTYFTSVDVIQLLMYLADDKFKVEEKNRIRRNLEGFHPTTISKNRANLEAFFTQIMEFPSPKPRNIEKDVKVFTWETLTPAIDKIMSKYSIVEESDGSESPVMAYSDNGSTLGLNILPPYHDPNASLYSAGPNTFGAPSSYGSSYNHATPPHFEGGSNHGSDSEHDYTFGSTPPNALGNAYAQPQPLYHGPVDGAYAFGSIEYGHPMRTVPTQGYTM